LVVEDSVADEELTLRALRRCGLPLTITVARDGAEAVAILKGDLEAIALEQAPRLVLLDLKLPGLDGLRVLEMVRSNARTATMPVVVLTSSDEEIDTVRAYGLGANSYVRKPVDFDAYLNAVAKTAEYWLTVNFWPN
jgi:two-component system, response regulator